MPDVVDYVKEIQDLLERDLDVGEVVDIAMEKMGLKYQDDQRRIAKEQAVINRAVYLEDLKPAFVKLAEGLDGLAKDVRKVDQRLKETDAKLDAKLDKIIKHLNIS